MTNKKFWSTTIKPFLTSKLHFSNDFITIEKDGELISHEKELFELFNENYVNLAEILSGKKPTSVRNGDKPSSDERNMKQMVKSYSSHPSNFKIKKKISIEKSFDLLEAYVVEINKTIESISTNKVTGPGGIPVKFFFPNVISSHLSKIINNEIFQNRYSENAKSLATTPVLKKDNQTKRKSYRPVSLLNVFIILPQFLPF